MTFLGREYRTVASRAPYTERAGEVTHSQKFFQTFFPSNVIS